MTPSDIKTQTVPCDLCHSTRRETVLHSRDLQHDTPGQWTIVRCLDCGLVYTDPRPAPESLHLVYPAEYKPYRPKRPKKHSSRWRLQQWSLRRHWNYPPPPNRNPLGFLLSWPFFLWTRCKLRNFDLFAYEGQGKLLDYGCGGGGYLRRMQERGWQVTGMDMSPQAVDACRQQGFDAHVGVSPAEQFLPGTFDVVTLWHVLEHVISPTDTLEQIHTVLRPAGKVVLALPNIDSVIARCTGPFWRGLELPRHLTHFGPATLTQMLQKAGFQLEHRIGAWPVENYCLVFRKPPSP